LAFTQAQAYIDDLPLDIDTGPTDFDAGCCFRAAVLPVTEVLDCPSVLDSDAAYE
jgi:hypothetical protein